MTVRRKHKTRENQRGKTSEVQPRWDFLHQGL